MALMRITVIPWVARSLCAVDLKLNVTVRANAKDYAVTNGGSRTAYDDAANEENQKDRHTSSTTSTFIHEHNISLDENLFNRQD